jgi:pimeloyl-ACP methyl ester carboxylesterase
VTTFIGALDPAHCAGIHLNMPLAVPSKDMGELTETEQADLAELAAFRKEGSAYSLLQGTKPQTLGVGLNDSPAGLLAWIVEKFQAWSDCDGDPENAFTKDQLLTNVMLYWVTGTITSSTRLYWERQHSGERGQPDVSVPTGVARYPKEILKFPRSWVERHYNVTRWEVMPRGGHFAAMEQPDLFADDVRSFFQTVS